MAEEWMEPSDDEIKMSFVASCIEDAADQEGVCYRDMFERMEKVGLIEDFIYKHYDTLHTESRRNVTDALRAFYKSRTCELFHDKASKLYLYGDYYIADEYLLEKGYGIK